MSDSESQQKGLWLPVPSIGPTNDSQQRRPMATVVRKGSDVSQNESTELAEVAAQQGTNA